MRRLMQEIKSPMAIVYIAFRPNIPDRYLPIEEIIDEDFAVATFCYNDVAADREDNFTEGLAGLLKKAMNGMEPIFTAAMIG